MMISRDTFLLVVASVLLWTLVAWALLPLI
jgi:hypothetical protein